MASEPPEIIGDPSAGMVAKVTSTISKMSMTGGIVGKISRILICFIFAIPLILWTGKEHWLTAMALLIASAVVFVFASRMMSFAEKHPAIALLDGDQWLAHQEAQKFPALPGSAAPTTNPALPEPDRLPPLIVNQADRESLKPEALGDETGAKNG